MRFDSKRRAWAAALVVGSLAPACATETAVPTTSSLEIVPLDDSADPLADAVVLPRGATVGTEGVPVGPGALRTVHFVRMGSEGGEPPAASLGRLRDWLEDVDVEGDQRWLIGSSQESVGPRREARTAWRSYLGRGAPVVTGADVADAQVSPDPATGGARVEVRLTEDASERFRVFTKANTRKRLAVVIDGHVDTALVVQQEIGGGRIQVTVAGDAAEQRTEAARLAAVLRAGAKN